MEYNKYFSFYLMTIPSLKLNYKTLQRPFFARDTHVVARELLGKLLIRSWRGTIYLVRINEVESYVGEDDKACHASRGLTPRTAVLFGEAGHAYVFLIYGMYHCLNVVTERKGFPAAVLIRGGVMESIVPESKLRLVQNKLDNLNGPGKLTRALRITRVQNYEDLTSSNKLFIADDGYVVSPRSISTTPRINVDYAGEDALLPWRYVVSL